MVQAIIYTGILLANQLLQKQAHLTGTALKNRVELPPDTMTHNRWMNGEEIEVIKPTVVCDYTSKMGGVD